MRSTTQWIFALAILCSVVPSRPALGAPQYGSEWTANNLGNIVVVADMSPDPGLEAVVFYATGGLHVVRLSDGFDLGPLPTVFGPSGTTFYARDVDGDNLAELVCVRVSQDPPGTTIGCLEFAGGTLVRKWSDVSLDYPAAGVEFMDLSPTEPWAIVATDVYLRIISSQSGSLLYESSTGIGTGWRVLSTTIDDFDADGFDEVLAYFVNAGNPADTRYDLIGDLTVTAGVQPFSGLELEQVRPNPMSGTTTIAYTLVSPETVRLQVFDAAGRLVRTLVNQRMAVGRHQTSWNGRDDAGSAAAAGMYFLELDVAGKTTTRKLVRLK